MFAAFAMLAAAQAAAMPSTVDLTVRGASAPQREEVVSALGVRGVEVDDDARAHAVVECTDACRVRISGSGGAARSTVSLERVGNEPLARAVALAVATALEDAARPESGTPTVALGIETSAVPRVALAAEFHVPFGRFDWSVGPVLAVSLAHYRGAATPSCCGGAWAGSLLAANTGFTAHIGRRWQVEPGANMRVGYATPLLTSDTGIVAATSRFGFEVTPSVAVRTPRGLAVRGTLIIPTYSAYLDPVWYRVAPTVELALVAALQ